MSIVRDNLMTREGYAPYCGDEECEFGMPRTHFNGRQFFCSCGWCSEFPDDFIAAYVEKWNLLKAERRIPAEGGVNIT